MLTQRNVLKVITKYDKVRNPINLYGAQYLDKLFTAGNNLSGFEGTNLL